MRNITFQLKTYLMVLCSLMVFTALSQNAEAASQESKPLWQIGSADGGNAEFALAPADHRQFRDDAYFVVGHSDPKQDWPYVHPGPSDSWAGSRAHTFTIVFHLEKTVAGKTCTFRVDLLDTHASGPPTLQVAINGHVSEQELPAGGGDASIDGQPALGKKHHFEIQFPSDWLHQGDNEIRLTTLRGSWLLYDALRLTAPGGMALGSVSARSFITECKPSRALIEREGDLLQPIRVSVRHIGNPLEVHVCAGATEPVPMQLQNGAQTLEIPIPSPDIETSLEITIESKGQTIASRTVVVKPVRPLVVYILPHSHTDIGYTEIQTAIEAKQVNNLISGIEYARKTAAYPEGARFVWNVEVLWAADLYLNRLSESQRAEFFEAVKNGWVSLNGMYLNELTGLCRPEELLMLFRYSTQLAERCGVTIDSAMISDVPGYTWGTVTAMAQAGIKYFSTAPNYFDRIGDILVQWENKPFYWVSPSGKEKVLVWIPYKGYAMSHIIHHLSPEFVADYQDQFDRTQYPFDIAYMRWSGHGDNAVPDPSICEFVKEWNAKYRYPRFEITSTSHAFRAFEERYGDRLPEVRGDWTPYWEDGAGSSSLETAMNRASSDRLSQAQALWAMFRPADFPAAAFGRIWEKVLLYSEHTWGAWCSVTDPENQMTKEQWEVKQSYALQADARSKTLLDSILNERTAVFEPKCYESRIDLINTTSWPRTELVLLPPQLSMAGDRVTVGSRRLPSQRLSSGELAVVVRDVPPFAAQRIQIAPGEAFSPASVSVQGAVLDNGLLRVRIDEKTGGIVELRAAGIEGNFADTASGHALNDFLFLPGNDLDDLQSNGPVRITMKESGPLVASLLVESDALGCNALIREIRLAAGMDYVELINTVDKKRAEINPNPGDWKFAQNGGKESVNFAFPFHVPDGQMWLDIPLGAIRPDRDQIPSACKNWFTVGRWADVSNDTAGITWVTLDAPLVQVGGITATLVGSQTNPEVWRKTVEPTQHLYSWAMNNHWGTNYRAYQEGPVVFRYALRPHRAFSPDEATRFATGLSQTLIAAPALGKAISVPRLRVEPESVVVTAFKPSDDGRAWIVRLFGASGRNQTARLEWSAPAPQSVWLSDTSEKPLRVLNGPIEVPAWEVVTLRAEISD